MVGHITTFKLLLCHAIAIGSLVRSYRYSTTSNIPFLDCHSVLIAIGSTGGSYYFARKDMNEQRKSLSFHPAFRNFVL